MADPVIHYTFDTDGTNSGTSGSTDDTSGTISTTNKFIGAGSLETTNETRSSIPKFNFTSSDTNGITFSFWLKHDGSVTNSYYLYSCHPSTTGVNSGSWIQLDTLTYAHSGTNLQLFSTDPNGAQGVNSDSQTDTITSAETAPIFDGNWHHIAVSYGKATLNDSNQRNRKTTVYIDNTIVCYADDWVGGFPDNQNNIVIIGETYMNPEGSFSKPWKGNYDDFRMYDYALDNSQITDVYKSGLIDSGLNLVSLVNSGTLTIADFFTRGYTVAQLLAIGFTQAEIDIGRTNIKIHTAFTIRDGTNESAFATDAVYTPTTFAAKLTTDLGYTVTAGGDLTTTDTTPYYRLYLQFANAVTLTNMPKYIFNIPFSNFSVKAGGQVNLRNVNLDADMTINPSYSTPVSFGYNTVFVTDTVFPYSTDFDGNAESNNMVNESPFSNIINNATKYFDRPQNAVAMNTDGSTMAMANGALGVKVYDRDSNESDGWKQVGGTIPAYGSSPWFATELYLSNNGQIIAITDQRAGTVAFAGYTVVYKRNPAVGIGWEMMGGNWDMQGDNVGASESRDYQRYASLSDDGTIVAVGTSNHSPGKVRVFNYDDGSNSWIQQGSTLSSTNGKTRRPALSGDGTIVAIVDETNAEVAIHSRDSTTSTVWNTIGNISVTGLVDIDINKNGDIFAALGTHIYVYKRDTNDASGWSLMGSAITMYSAGARIQIDDIGHTVTVTSHYYGGFDRGILMIYKYNTTSLAWEHAVTNNAISGTTNTVVAGGTDPILGYHYNQQYAVNGHTLTGDGSTVILSSNGINGTGSECYIYNIPHIKVTSNTSTIPAGNYFINNFVSTIKTDLVNFPLSYDASNALITFDSLAQDISMSITSMDTTIFDTSITEITQGANTLPFITYGQPDPRLKNYSDNGITVSEFLSNGYTIPQLLAGSVIPDWNFDTDANHFDQSYVKGFTDVSGSVVIRNDNKLITNGELSLGGNLQGSVSLVIDDMTLKSRLFMGEDITANGKVYVGGDLSVNGQFSGDFLNNSIPESAILLNPIDISGNVLSLDDISFNGPTVDVSNTLQVNQIEFNDGTTMTTHDDNILSGSFADSIPDVVFKDSVFAQVTCEGAVVADSKTTSDYRIKENVTELNETDTVDALVPIQYNNTLSGNHEFGLLAHELQEIYPDLVNGEKDGDEYQRVQYNGLIGVLVKEVQDLKQRLAILNNR